MVVASENLLFLWFPTRPPTAVAGDMGMVGRQTVAFVCRLVVLVSVGAVVAVFAFVGYTVAGHSLAVATAAAWVPLLAAIVALVALMADAFGKFDPSADVPA